jgi:hypothetical protein
MLLIFMHLFPDQNAVPVHSTEMYRGIGCVGACVVNLGTGCGWSTSLFSHIIRQGDVPWYSNGVPCGLQSQFGCSEEEKN